MLRTPKSRETAVLKRQKCHIEDDAPHTDESTRNLFRRYFEQSYAPIEQAETTIVEQAPSPDQDDAFSDASSSVSSEWSGISEGNAPDSVEVIDHTRTDKFEHDLATKLANKSYMSARPPTMLENGHQLQKTKVSETAEDDSTEAANMKNDLALQRLLKESHLLESNKSATPIGSRRHQAVDMRLQALGSKGSIFSQNKMPMSHRRGIQAKAFSLESRRRTEAKENGIILERPSSASKSSRRRDRGIGGPAIGKFTGGTLKLSRKDLQGIRGAPATGRRSRRGRG